MFSDFDYCTMMMYKNILKKKNILVLRKFMLKYLQIKGAVYNLVSNSAKKPTRLEN